MCLVSQSRHSRQVFTHLHFGGNSGRLRRSQAVGEKTVATVSTVVSLGRFDEWAYFLRRLSGSTNFTVAAEYIFGRRKGGAGWRVVARGQQKEEGGPCSEIAYINTK